jgi:cytoskeleton protein RodZ
MVTKPVKLPEIRTESFTKARESLGLTTKVLSGMACLSIRQVEQIENGESSSFYGDQVKFTAAKKVAGLLRLTPEEAFDFSGIAQPAKSSEVAEKLQEEVKASAVNIKTKSEKIKENHVSPLAVESIAESKFDSASKTSQKAIDQGKESKGAVDPKKKLFLLLTIGVAVIFSVVNLRPLFFPEQVKEEVVIIQEVAQEPIPADTAVDAKPAPAATLEQVPVAVSAECPPVDAASLNYKPEAPKKSGDMVYLQSKTAQTVCVVDASGKTQSKVLEPGVGVSVFGKPPLKVLTGDLNQVDLYYQGAKVRIGNTGGKTINLEPAEIIQPAALSTSSDSQLR